MPHSVAREANRNDDLHTDVDREVARDQLGLPILLFTDRIGASRSLSSGKVSSHSLLSSNQLESLKKNGKKK